MSTLLALTNEVLRRAGQTEVATVTGSRAPALQVKDFINAIYFEMLQFLKVDRLLKQTTLDTLAGMSAYSPAADADLNAIAPDSVMEADSGILLKRVDYSYPLKFGVSATGRPDSWYVQGDNLMLYPVPDTIYTIRYHYYVKPQTLSADADTTELPEEWEKTLVLGAQSRLEKFLGEAGSEDSFLLYRDGLSRLKARGVSGPGSRMRGNYRGYKP